MTSVDNVGVVGCGLMGAGIALTTINKAKFRKPVVPGDQIRFELDIIKKRQTLCVMAGKGFVDGDLVVEAELSALVMNKEDFKK